MSKLCIVDNSGGKIVRIFHIYGGFFCKDAKIGNIVKSSVRAVIYKNLARYTKKKLKQVLRGQRIKCIILRSKKTYTIKSGFSFNFSNNDSIIMRSNGRFRFTRVVGPVSLSLIWKTVLEFFNIYLN